MKIFTIVIFLAILSQQSFAGGMCNKANEDPCSRKNIKEELDLDRTNHVQSFCQMVKANDKACSQSLPMGIAYASMAVLCGVACAAEYYTVGISWIAQVSQVCTIASTAVSLADAGMAVNMRSGNGYIKTASTSMTEDWGFAPGLAASAANGLAVLGSFQNNLGDLFFTQAKEAAESTAKETSEKELSRENGSACLSMVVDAAAAAIKFIDFKRINDSSMNNMNRARQVANNYRTQNLADGGNDLALSSPADDAASPTSGAVNDSKDLKDFANNLDQSGQIADSLATGDLKKFLGNKPKADFQKALDALKKNTKLSIGDIAASFKDKGLSETLGKIIGNSDKFSKFKNALNKTEDKMKQTYLASLQQPTFTESSQPKALNGRNVPNRRLGSLFSDAPSEAKQNNTDELKFSGLSGDIWHRGSEKSIFEIVSDRTHQTSNQRDF